MDEIQGKIDVFTEMYEQYIEGKTENFNDGVRQFRKS